MTNNEKNLNKFDAIFNRLNEQNPGFELLPSKGNFSFPFEEEKLIQFQIEILDVTFFYDQEKETAYWQILCCGPDCHHYAELLYRDEPSASVLCNDLHGTRNGEELFSIHYIIS